MDGIFSENRAVTAAGLCREFERCADYQERRVLCGLREGLSVSVCWLDGVASGGDIASELIRPLTDVLRSAVGSGYEETARLLSLGGIWSASLKERGTLSEVTDDLTHGRCAVVFDTLGRALTFELRSSNVRAVSSPTLEKSLKGAKDSFVEVLRTNTGLIRRRIASPGLKCVESTLGRRSKTTVSILYIEGIADPAKLRELARRLDSVDVDAISSTGMLEDYITDCPLSPFPQIIHTERPDRFAMYLLDGRIGLLIDGLPIGLIVPAGFAEFMKVTGDSNQHFLVSTGLTLLRYLALFIALLLPAFYVAIAMFHQEMIPARLLMSVISAKRNVPFPTGAEVFGMLITFSLLQEAGLRLPNPVGDTVSIIGALIVGQSAVEAQVASPIAIIVVATSGIACYTLPSQDLASAIRLARLALVAAASFAGLFGVAAVCILLLVHLASLDSFGTDYTAPLTDGRRFPLARLLLRFPRSAVKLRDRELNTPDRRRQK